MEVLWITHRDLVNEEMKRLEEEEGRTCPKFQLRTAASKNIISNMCQNGVRGATE